MAMFVYELFLENSLKQKLQSIFHVFFFLTFGFHCPFVNHICVFVCVFCHPAISKDVLVDLSGVLNTDPHILATGHTGTHTRSTQITRILNAYLNLKLHIYLLGMAIIRDLTIQYYNDF